MSMLEITRLAGDTQFWRRHYGPAYLTKAELTAGDYPARKSITSRDHRAAVAAAMKINECEKALKKLIIEPAYPIGWKTDKEGKWTLWLSRVP